MKKNDFNGEGCAKWFSIKLINAQMTCYKDHHLKNHGKMWKHTLRPSRILFWDRTIFGRNHSLLTGQFDFHNYSTGKNSLQINFRTLFTVPRKSCTGLGVSKQGTNRRTEELERDVLYYQAVTIWFTLVI